VRRKKGERNLSFYTTLLMQIIKQVTKTLVTRNNERSSDAVSPNFVYGCLGGCMKSYCYVSRYNPDKVYVTINVDDIFTSLEDWVKYQPFPKIPNQVDDIYYVIDIGCSTDVPLMSKHFDWNEVFEFFNKQPKLKSTFATKYPSLFDPRKYNIDPAKNRIRVSLMPQKYSDILEPKTDLIKSRIERIPFLQEHMELHINFSPIIYEKGWLDEYKKLFEAISLLKVDFKSECIFLTYHDNQIKNNSAEINSLCYKPHIQEYKDSHYAKNNIRYKSDVKNILIKQFKDLYKNYFPEESIRYIF